MNEKTEVISVSELAARLGVHRSTILYWIRNGYLKASKRGIASKSPYLIAETEARRIESVQRVAV